MSRPLRDDDPEGAVDAFPLAAPNSPARTLPIDPDVNPKEDERHQPQPPPFGEDARSPWPRLQLAVLAAVFAGGCAGGVARYAVTQRWVTPPGQFPWATLSINTSGAFLLGLLLVLLIEVVPATKYLRPLLGTGFFGAWTTFSSIVVTADQLLAHGHAGLGVAYVLASAVAGLAAASLGLVLGRAIGAYRHREREQTGGA